MSPKTAETVLYVIAATALIVWVFGFEFLRLTARQARMTGSKDTEGFLAEELPSTDSTLGEVEIAGSPGELSTKLASLIARNGINSMGAVELTKVDNNNVVFQASGMTPNPRHGAFNLRGEITFQAVKPGRSIASYRLEVPRRRGLMITAWSIQAVGLVALIAVFLVMRGFVVDHPNPNVRVQVVQTAQVGHLLWLPFLFCGLARSQQKHARIQIQSMLTNLPYA